MTYNNHIHVPVPAQSTYAITHHADARMQQRGISEEMIGQAIEIGTVFQKQGMDMVVVRKKDIPKSMSRQAAGKLNGLVILIKGGAVITSYKRGQCAVRHLKKKIKKDMKKRHRFAA